MSTWAGLATAASANKHDSRAAHVVPARFVMDRISSPLLQLRELLAHHLRGQRQIVPIARHDLLAFAAQHVAQKFMELWIERVTGRAIHIDVDIAHERVAAILESRRGRHHVGSAVPFGQGDGLDTRGTLGLGHNRPGDSIAIVSELVVEHVPQSHPLLWTVLVRDHLASRLDIFTVVRIPLVAVLQNLPLEKAGRARGCVPVGLNRLVRPLAPEAELAPGADVLLLTSSIGGRPLEPTHAGSTLGSEYSIELLDRELGYRIVGIDEHDDPVGSSLYVESA